MDTAHNATALATALAAGDANRADPEVVDAAHKDEDKGDNCRCC